LEKAKAIKIKEIAIPKEKIESNKSPSKAPPKVPVKQKQQP